MAHEVGHTEGGFYTGTPEIQEEINKITEEVIENYGVDDYTKHRVGWMSSSVDSLFNNDRVTVMTLEDFI